MVHKLEWAGEVEYAGARFHVVGEYTDEGEDSTFEITALSIDSQDVYGLLESTDHLEAIAEECRRKLDLERKGD